MKYIKYTVTDVSHCMHCLPIQPNISQTIPIQEYVWASPPSISSFPRKKNTWVHKYDDILNEARRCPQDKRCPDSLV